ncbi:MAG: 16S rRNA (cytidine(1402)-2'-O)-methyltransferase [Candidatus Zixiibacteriota bacterium]
MATQAGKLYLVPTPIGNLGDITQRAVEVLQQVDLVACEDTRRSGRLLKHLGLSKKLISYYDFNEASRAQQLLTKIKQGMSIAVITDAGSPGISDPAYRIVQAAIAGDVDIVPLPGATAIIPALSASGLPTDRFFFEGFLPHKPTTRRKHLEKLIEFEHTLVFYESPHRVEKTLYDMLKVLGNRQACLAREISKLYEQFIRGSISDILTEIASKPPKGEIVLIIEGKRTKVKSKLAQ